MPTPPANSGSDARGLLLISSAVAQMVVPILVGVWLDNKYGWKPWGMVAGAVLGIVGGGWSLYVISRRMNRDDRPESGHGSSPPEN